jgi:hypothetical protein
MVWGWREPRRRAALGRMRGFRSQSLSGHGGPARPRQQVHLPVTQIPMQARARPVVAQRGGDRALRTRRHAGLGQRLARAAAYRRRRAKDGEPRCTGRLQGRARGAACRTGGARGSERGGAARGCRGEAIRGYRASNIGCARRARAMDRRPIADGTVRLHRRCHRAVPAHRGATGRRQGGGAGRTDRRVAGPHPRPSGRRPSARRGR